MAQREEKLGGETGRHSWGGEKIRVHGTEKISGVRQLQEGGGGDSTLNDMQEVLGWRGIMSRGDEGDTAYKDGNFCKESRK